jgi:ketosteroid isomerase-like protein
VIRADRNPHRGATISRRDERYSRAVSEQDVEQLRDGFSRLAEEGYQSLLPLVHPEFEMTTLPGIAAEPQTYRGAEGMRRWWESFYEVMDEVQVVPSEFHDAGDGKVVIAATLRATGQSSGLEVAQLTFLLIRLRDGRIHRIEFFQSLDDALAAAAD